MGKKRIDARGNIIELKDEEPTMGWETSSKFRNPNMERETLLPLKDGAEILDFDKTPHDEKVPADSKRIRDIPNLMLGLGFDENQNPVPGRKKHPSIIEGLKIPEDVVVQLAVIDLYLSLNPTGELASRLLKVSESYPDYCTFHYNNLAMGSTVDSITFTNFQADISRRITNPELEGLTLATRRDFRQFPVFRKFFIYNYGNWDVWMIFDRGQAFAGLGVGFLIESMKEYEFPIMFTNVHFYAASQKAKLVGGALF